MPQVFPSAHPLVAAKLARLRDRRTDPKKFRELIREISLLLIYEATADLPTYPVDIETPMGTARCRDVVEKIGLVPILRAGLGMVEGVWEMLPGAEVWYGGNQDFACEKLDKVWPEVEDRLSVRRADYALHPWGNEDLKRHLVLKTDDFDDASAAALVAEEKETITDRLLRRRMRKVDWKALDLGVSIHDVEDGAIAVDTRDSRAFVIASVVAVKAAMIGEEP
jgi:hypothetical protein